MKINTSLDAKATDAMQQLGMEFSIYSGLETALSGFEDAIDFIPEQMNIGVF
jgi:hypothetical protein